MSRAGDREAETKAQTPRLPVPAVTSTDDRKVLPLGGITSHLSLYELPTAAAPRRL